MQWKLRAWCDSVVLLFVCKWGHTEAALVTDQGYAHLCPRGQRLNTWGEEGRVQSLSPAPVNFWPFISQSSIFLSILHCRPSSDWITAAHDEEFVLVGTLQRPNNYTKLTVVVLIRILLKLCICTPLAVEIVDTCAQVEKSNATHKYGGVVNNDYFPDYSINCFVYKIKKDTRGHPLTGFVQPRDQNSKILLSLRSYTTKLKMYWKG